MNPPTVTCWYGEVFPLMQAQNSSFCFLFKCRFFRRHRWHEAPQQSVSFCCLITDLTDNLCRLIADLTGGFWCLMGGLQSAFVQLVIRCLLRVSGLSAEGNCRVSWSTTTHNFPITYNHLMDIKLLIIAALKYLVLFFVPECLEWRPTSLSEL